MRKYSIILLFLSGCMADVDKDKCFARYSDVFKGQSVGFRFKVVQRSDYIYCYKQSDENHDKFYGTPLCKFSFFGKRFWHVNVACKAKGLK